MTAVHLHLNTKLSIKVDQQAFIGAMHQLLSNDERWKVNKKATKIQFIKAANNIIILIDIKLKLGIDLGVALSEIKEKIETQCQLLMDQKPNNIIINFLGWF